MNEIAKGILYIGADDNQLDLFESQYLVPGGMSYNSYLIKDEKVAIMDTADRRVCEKWLQNLEEALQGRQPDYLVVHHMEPDHSALVGKVVEKYPSVQVVASAKAIQMLGQFLPGKELKTLAIKEGDTLPLGAHQLQFFAAPMVHWPEVMLSLDTATGVLFSADAFGKFGSLSQCGFYGEDDQDWASEGRRYYFNICGKYGPQVQALLKKLPVAEVKTIAPLHGPILRQNLGYYLDLYNTWSSYGVETPGVLVAYASIHGGTEEVALRVADLLRAKGCPKVVTCDLTRSDRAEAIEDAFRYGTLVMAACSYDAGLFTPAYDFLHSLQMKGWQKRRVALIENGSWAPSAARVMKEMFAAMKDIEFVGDVVTIKSRYKAEDQPALEALCKAILS